jgi:hypothetical protein
VHRTVAVITVSRASKPAVRICVDLTRPRPANTIAIKAVTEFPLRVPRPDPSSKVVAVPSADPDTIVVQIDLVRRDKTIAVLVLTRAKLRCAWEHRLIAVITVPVCDREAIPICAGHSDPHGGNEPEE